MTLNGRSSGLSRVCICLSMCVCVCPSVRRAVVILGTGHRSMVYCILPVTMDIIIMIKATVLKSPSFVLPHQCIVFLAKCHIAELEGSTKQTEFLSSLKCNSVVC